MNVTFILGNGFDISLGLKTGYRDFLKEYIKSESNDVVVTTFKKAIKDDFDGQNEERINNWSDLELAFGGYLENLKSENEIEILYNDIYDSIHKYIKNQEVLVIEESFTKEISAKFEKDVTEFYRELSSGRKKKMLDTTKIKNAIEHMRINFVSFNYTSSLKKCIDTYKEIGYQINNKNKARKDLTTTLGKQIYIHGTLRDNTIMFGVDNLSQVHFKGELSDRIKNMIVKPSKNSYLGLAGDTLAKVCINESNIICVFGTSLGETDLIWWKALIEWLKNNSNRYLILCMYNTKINKSTPRYQDIKMQEELRIRDDLMIKSSLNVPDKESVTNRIDVILNSELFQYNFLGQKECIELLPEVGKVIEKGA